MDVPLKADLSLSEVKEVHSCGNNAVQEKKQEVYEGTLIKVSVTDAGIIDLVNVHKLELWNHRASKSRPTGARNGEKHGKE